MKGMISMTNERFDSSIGEHYSPTYIAGLSDKELADEINKLDFMTVIFYEICVIEQTCLTNTVKRMTLARLPKFAKKPPKFLELRLTYKENN